MTTILCRSCNELKSAGQDWHCGQCVSAYVREQTLIRHNQARRIAVLEQGNRSFKAEEQDWHEMNAHLRAVNAQLVEACEALVEQVRHDNESEACHAATEADLGVSEWEAFMPTAWHRGNAALKVAEEGE